MARVPRKGLSLPLSTISSPRVSRSEFGPSSISSYSARTFADSVSHRIILDGEMLVWDPNLQKSLPFGTLKSFITSQSRCLRSSFSSSGSSLLRQLTQPILHHITP